MSAIYDNWERLVAAVVKKQQLWELFHDHSRSPSILSEASDLRSSPSLSFVSWSPLDDHGQPLSDFANLRTSSTHPRTPKLVFISNFSPAIDIKGVNHLASSVLLGRGTLGSSYAVAMNNNGPRIVVKRLSSTILSDSEFNRRVGIVGGVKHENVVALRGYYSSKGDRLMMYDHYTRGSVHTLLHGRNRAPPESVDWESRLKIAIGAARGLTEIHKQNGGKLVHGNFRASNVFLNPNQYGCVSDFGLTSMIDSTFQPTAYCYAPEVKNTKNASQASDVYSFGVLLLELLTRKPTVHVPGGPQAVDLVELVASVRSSERTAMVFDADLLKLPTIRGQTVKMLQIGMRCIEKSAKKRPKISQVVNMLEDIIVLNWVSRAPAAVGGLVFSEDGHPIFGIGDVLIRASEVLGKGPFGTLSVGRLRDAILSLKYFRDNVNDVSSLSNNEYIAGVSTYCFTGNEKVLVYDYSDQCITVSALLHGVDTIPRTPLVLESRLKIAVGAARAIAHFHKQDGRKLVHGNISSSNICIYTQNYMNVPDRLANLCEPVSWSGMRNLCYRAPEVTDTGTISQASDVYSFGVVLLELLYGTPPTFYRETTNSLVDRAGDYTDATDKVFDYGLNYGTRGEMMIKLWGIAKECVSDNPIQRPKMSQVVKMLEQLISKVESAQESRLEDLLEDLLPTLHN